MTTRTPPKPWLAKRCGFGEIKDEFSLPWLVVFCLLSPYLTINPGKRYEEVDGVRKEKERLTTDCLSYTIKHIFYPGHNSHTIKPHISFAGFWCGNYGWWPWDMVREEGNKGPLYFRTLYFGITQRPPKIWTTFPIFPPFSVFIFIIPSKPNHNENEEWKRKRKRLKDG